MDFGKNHRVHVVGAIILVIGTFAWLGYGFVNMAPYDDNTVQRYCEYGAVSEAQLQGCFEHVTISDVTGRDTEAARFATGKLTTCGFEAGPFCHDE